MIGKYILKISTHETYTEFQYIKVIAILLKLKNNFF